MSRGIRHSFGVFYILYAKSCQFPAPCHPLQNSMCNTKHYVVGGFLASGIPSQLTPTRRAALVQTCNHSWTFTINNGRKSIRRVRRGRGNEVSCFGSRDDGRPCVKIAHLGEHSIMLPSPLRRRDAGGEVKYRGRETVLTEPKVERDLWCVLPGPGQVRRGFDFAERSEHE